MASEHTNRVPAEAPAACVTPDNDEKPGRIMIREFRETENR